MHLVSAEIFCPCLCVSLPCVCCSVISVVVLCVGCRDDAALLCVSRVSVWVASLLPPVCFACCAGLDGTSVFRMLGWPLVLADCLIVICLNDCRGIYWLSGSGPWRRVTGCGPGCLFFEF